MTFLDIFLLLGGLIVLIKGGDFLIKSALKIADKLHVTPLVAGLTIIAFGTSCPELFVSVQSAVLGYPDMTMGNVIGSNICNITLVLGCTAMFSPIKVDSYLLKINWPVAMGSSFLIYLLIRKGHLGKQEGFLLIGILILYILFLTTKGKDKKKNISSHNLETPKAKAENKERKKSLLGRKYKFWLTEISKTTLGCVGLYLGSEWFLKGVIGIFASFDISHRVIGILILALGTSLPELAISIIASLKKNTDIALGNLIGSNIFNILSILGIASIISDIEINETIKNYDIIWMLAITLGILPLMLIGKKINKWKGIILLSTYAYYIYSII